MSEYGIISSPLDYVVVICILVKLDGIIIDSAARLDTSSFSSCFHFEVAVVRAHWLGFDHIHIVVEVIGYY